MGMFKSKEQKKLEQKMLLKKTVVGIRKYIEQLEGQKEKYLEAAKRAKRINSESQYSLALSGLKTVLTQQKKAEEMLLNFELTSQMRDMMEITGGFLGSLSSISKEMYKLTKDMDFAKVQTQFEKAMTGVEETAEKLDILMENSSDTFDSISTSTSKIDSAELDRLIDVGAGTEEDSIDSDIEARMAEIKKKLTE